MGEKPRISVTVVLAEPGRQQRVPLRLARGATVAEAVASSGLLDDRRQAAPAGTGFGVYGRAVDPRHELEDGDRVEILRPLPQDPKSRRRKRAREGRTMGAGARRDRAPGGG